jgi:hypothetical protein
MLLLVLAAVCSGACHHDWDQVSEFERALSCGMKVSEVRSLAARMGATDFGRPQLAGTDASIPDYYVSKNERLISLWFDEQGGLVSYMSSLTSFEHEGESASGRVELCVTSRISR